MRIDALFTPTEHDRASLAGRVAVVVDVLRASTTIVEALASGATEVIPTVDVPDALALAGEGLVVAGERGGLRCEGFDLGNSPREFTPGRVGGRRVALCTTNGTRAVDAAVRGGAAEILAGAFTNLKSVILHAASAGRGVAAVCAGRDGEFSLEDAVCAGGLVAGLAYRVGPRAERTDAAAAAESLFRTYREDLIRLFTVTAHGRRLIELGLADDFAVCGKLNSRELVPRLVETRGGRRAFVRAPATGA